MSLTCGCYEEGPEFVKSTHPTAKKAHKCYECGRQIDAGEVYERTAGKWDGEFYVFKTCEQCEDLRESLSALGFCPAFGEVRADHREYIETYQPQALNAQRPYSAAPALRPETTARTRRVRWNALLGVEGCDESRRTKSKRGMVPADTTSE